MNDNLLFLVIINFLLFSAALTYYIFKIRKFNLGIFVLSIFTLSSFFSILHFKTSSNSLIFNKIELIPFIFLFVCILMCLNPLLNLNVEKIVFKVSKKNISLFHATIIITTVLTIEPFIENIFVLIKNQNSGFKNLGALYANKIEGSKVEIYSVLGRRLNFICVLLTPVSVIFSFYLISVKKNKYLIYPLLLISINSLLTPLNTANRAGIVSFAMLLLINYNIFKFYMNKNIRKKIALSGIILSSVILTGLFAITISRYNESNSSIGILNWLYLYLGEGFLKFNNDLWLIKIHTMGDDTLCFIKDILGFKTFTDNFSRDSYYLRKNGIQIENFYTIIGDIYYDFSIIGTLLVCLFFYTYLNLAINKNKFISIDKLIILVFYTHAFSMGFTAYIHRAYTAQIALLVPFVYILIIKIQLLFPSKKII
jgi:oligosaccharide repeat unit polymerase